MTMAGVGNRRMQALEDHYALRMASTDADIRAAQRLRYTVFIEELGADGTLVDHDERLEIDQFDAHYDHLILVDRRIDPASLDHVVGVYRLMPSDKVHLVGRFYCADEYDLTPLINSGRKLLELGRSCVHPDHRGGAVMFHLWNGLADYVLRNKIEILFGVASFHGTDLEPLKAPLSFLHHHHLAPPELRVTARPDAAQRMDLIAPEDLSRKEAMLETPALIKAYIRLGGFVGEGAWVDRAFNCTDVCLIMDTAKMNARSPGQILPIGKADDTDLDRGSAAA